MRHKYLLVLTGRHTCLFEFRLERFSNEFRRTNIKVITLANHKGHKQYSEPIKTPSACMWLTPSAGKHGRASDD